MYVPTDWKDEVVEHPNRYRETVNGDGSVEHIPDPGEKLQEGTPQSATNFNHMEKGIFEAHEMCAENTRILRSSGQKLDGIVGDIIQVTLTNSQEYPFNNSLKTVQLSVPRNNKDYTVAPEIVSRSGGAVGDIIFSDKLLNGFKVEFTGSAKTVVLNLYVRGGM